MLNQVQQTYGADLRKETEISLHSFSTSTTIDVDELSELWGSCDATDSDSDCCHSDPPSPRRSSMTKKRPSAPKRNVSFDKVEIRVFERVLADNPPSCAPGGPSLGLGWNYYMKPAVDVVKHDKSKNSLLSLVKKKSKGKKDDILLTPAKREKIAKKAGFTQTEIQTNCQQMGKVLRQRKRTVDAYMEEQYDAMFIAQMARHARALY